MSQIKTGASILVKARDLVAVGQRVTNQTPGVAVTYSAKLNGAPSISGALSWEPYGLEGTWAALATAPSTPGAFTVVITADAVIDGNPVRGVTQTSVELIP